MYYVVRKPATGQKYCFFKQTYAFFMSWQTFSSGGLYLSWAYYWVMYASMKVRLKIGQNTSNLCLLSVDNIPSNIVYYYKQ